MKFRVKLNISIDKEVDCEDSEEAFIEALTDKLDIEYFMENEVSSKLRSMSEIEIIEEKEKTDE